MVKFLKQNKNKKISKCPDQMVSNLGQILALLKTKTKNLFLIIWNFDKCWSYYNKCIFVLIRHHKCLISENNFELQSHPMLAFEERSRLCRCLNYNKLSFEVCKDLAKNPRIPPIIAMQALISQQPNVPSSDLEIQESEIIKTDSFLEEKEDMRENLQRMELRVKELEILCKEMQHHISKFH